VSDSPQRESVSTTRAANRKHGCYGLDTLGGIQVGDQKAPLVRANQSDFGWRLVTLIAPQPFWHIGAGVPDAKPKTEHDLALCHVRSGCCGQADLRRRRARGEADNGTDDAIVVDDYGSEAVQLSGIGKQ